MYETHSAMPLRAEPHAPRTSPIYTQHPVPCTCVFDRHVGTIHIPVRRCGESNTHSSATAQIAHRCVRFTVCLLDARSWYAIGTGGNTRGVMGFRPSFTKPSQRKCASANRVTTTTTEKECMNRCVHAHAQLAVKCESAMYFDDANIDNCILNRDTRLGQSMLQTGVFRLLNDPPKKGRGY